MITLLPDPHDEHETMATLEALMPAAGATMALCLMFFGLLFFL